MREGARDQEILMRGEVNAWAETPSTILGNARLPWPQHFQVVALMISRNTWGCPSGFQYHLQNRILALNLLAKMHPSPTPHRPSPPVRAWEKKKKRSAQGNILFVNGSLPHFHK